MKTKVSYFFEYDSYQRFKCNIYILATLYISIFSRRFMTLCFLQRGCKLFTVSKGGFKVSWLTQDLSLKSDNLASHCYVTVPRLQFISFIGRSTWMRESGTEFIFCLLLFVCLRHLYKYCLLTISVLLKSGSKRRVSLHHLGLCCPPGQLLVVSVT